MHTAKRTCGMGCRLYRFIIEHGRYVWLDLPLIALVYLHGQHFWTQGRFPAPEWFTYLCWGLLAIYLPAKEDAHKRFHDMRTRWGFPRVIPWVILVTLCALLNSRNPQRFSVIPPLMPETMLIVVGIFVFGVFLSKKRVAGKLLETLGRIAARYGK